MTPFSRSFRELWTIRVSGDISPGDSGSWVIDLETGELYGHVVSGHPGFGIAYMIPAKDIAQDIEARSGQPLSLQAAPSDVIILVTFCKGLYRKCRNAGGRYNEISRDVRGLHTVLRHLKYEVEAPESLVNCDSSLWERQLAPILEDCDWTMRQLDELIKNEGLDIINFSSFTTPMGLRENLKYGSKEEDALQNIRTKLISYKTSLTLLLDTTQLHQGGEKADVEARFEAIARGEVIPLSGASQKKSGAQRGIPPAPRILASGERDHYHRGGRDTPSDYDSSASESSETDESSSGSTPSSFGQIITTNQLLGLSQALTFRSQLTPRLRRLGPDSKLNAFEDVLTLEGPFREPSELAPDLHGNEISTDAKWTKVNRRLVSLEVLEQDQRRYEARPEFVAILGILSRAEIQDLSARSHVLREARRRRDLPAQVLPPPPIPKRPASIASNFSASSYSSSGSFFARSSSPNRSEIGSDDGSLGLSAERYRNRDYERRHHGHGLPIASEERTKSKGKGRFNENLGSTGVGGAAASLLGVLREAAEGL